MGWSCHKAEVRNDDYQAFGTIINPRRGFSAPYYLNPIISYNL